MSALGVAFALAAAPPILAKPDEPVLVDASQYPYSAIGRVNSAGRSFCTGFLVSASTLLTAAHCLYDLQTARWYEPDEIHFVAGYQRDQWLAHSRAAGYTVSKQYQPKAPPNLQTSLEDWAVVRLEKAVGEQVGWLGVEPLGRRLWQALSEGRIKAAQVGYRRDRAHAQTLRGNCGAPEVFGKGRGLLHACDVIELASGSPLLVFREGRPFVVGLHTIRAENKDGRVFAGAVSTAIFHPEYSQGQAVEAARSAGMAWKGGRAPAQ